MRLEAALTRLDLLNMDSVLGCLAIEEVQISCPPEIPGECSTTVTTVAFMERGAGKNPDTEEPKATLADDVNVKVYGALSGTDATSVSSDTLLCANEAT